MAWLAVLAILIASPALAAPKGHTYKAPIETVLKNPDGRPSIELLAGIGNEDADGHNVADLTRFGVHIIYPASVGMSILARWDHDDRDWSTGGGGLTDNVFSIGLKFYLP